MKKKSILINAVYNAIRAIKRSVHDYKDINSIDDLHFSKAGHKLDYDDLSKFDLQENIVFFEGYLENPWLGITTKEDHKTVIGWTENVIWPTPDKIPSGFNPQKILQDSKIPQGMQELHKDGINGKGINIAIIDQTLAEHPEYNDRIKKYEIIGDNWGNFKNGDYHGSLVAGCAVGKTTGSAPGANLYFIAANNWPDDANNLTEGHYKYRIDAIKRILEINETLPENDKIRFLSCSFYYTKNEEFQKLIKQCNENGILTMVCHDEHMEQTVPYDSRYGNRIDSKIGIPTNGKTTPYYTGGYIYNRTGGNSSINPYLAGIFACACQGNQLFFSRQNWQQELWDIFIKTSTTNEYGGKVVNSVAIRKRVTEITREMEMNLIKQKSIQHE